MFGNPLASIQKYPIRSLSDCCEINPRRPLLNILDSDLVSFVPMPSVNENGFLQDLVDEEYGKVKKGFTYFENNDVLFAKITPCMENGKGAIAHLLTNGIGMGSTEFHVLRPIKNISNPYWLLCLTRMPVFRDMAAKNMSGTGGQKRVGSEYISNFKVGLPPIDLQVKFAELYKQADKSKFTGFKSQFIEMFGSCLNKVEITSLCDVFIDGDWIESRDQSDIGIRLIQTGNVGDGFFKDKDDKSRFINEETFVRLNCTEIIAGDVLVSRLPDPIGRACIIPDSIGKAITAVDCTIMRFKNTLLPEFFIAYTQTPDYQLQINEVSTGTTRRRVSRMNLGKIRIICPTIEEQKQFVEIAQQADKSKYIN